MTDFQIALLVVGALAIAGVLVYNRVQERGARRHAERFSGARHRDVLLDPVARRREPTLEPQPQPDRDSTMREEILPDASVDYVVDLTAAQGMPAALILEQWEPVARRFASRSILAAADDTGGWHRLAAPGGSSRSQLRAALQLVTRAGAVSEAEIIEFRSQVETMAARLGAAAAAPEMRQAMEIARELDRLCADADIQVALHLVAGAGKSLDRALVEHAAKDAGLEPEGAGRFAHRDRQGRLLFVATERDGGGTKGGPIEALTLLLEVPRVIETRRAYESMVRCAHHLAGLLGGDLVDDNGRALDERALAVIEGELVRISQALEGRGIVPGGPLALRLFS